MFGFSNPTSFQLSSPPFPGSTDCFARSLSTAGCERRGVRTQVGGPRFQAPIDVDPTQLRQANYQNAAFSAGAELNCSDARRGQDSRRDSECSTPLGNSQPDRDRPALPGVHAQSLRRDSRGAVFWLTARRSPSTLDALDRIAQLMKPFATGTERARPRQKNHQRPQPLPKRAIQDSNLIRR